MDKGCEHSENALPITTKLISVRENALLHNNKDLININWYKCNNFPKKVKERRLLQVTLFFIKTYKSNLLHVLCFPNLQNKLIK